MAKYQIEAPVRSFSGVSVGVQFDRGTGYVTPDTKEGRAALEYFRRHGYGVALAEEFTEAERVQALATGNPPQREPLDDEFDPGEHKAEAVLAHLDAADHAEALRVLDAEAAGKNRTTITGKRDDILAAKNETEAGA